MISKLVYKTTNTLLAPFGMEIVNRWNPYEKITEINQPSDEVLDTAKQIRGINRPPAIIIHGVNPRSGTVYAGKLIRMHPDIYAYPNGMWETPFLGITSEILSAQQHFFNLYKNNQGKIGENDFLPLFGASFVRHLYNSVPEGKSMLLKIPDVSYLNYFPVVFPYEDIVLLLRDGRDVVASTMKTWPDTDFKQICEEWSNNAKIMLEFSEKCKSDGQRYSLIKYEEIVEDPAQFIRTICQRYELDESKYPFEEITSVPVRGSSTIQNKGDVDWSPRVAPKNFQPVGHWHSWTNREKKIFKKIAGEALLKAGYCDNLNW